MKNRIYRGCLLICMMISYISSAQSTNKNYVSTTTYQIAVDQSNFHTVGANDKIHNVSYFDELGRPIQNNAVHAGGDKEDVITSQVYDAYGRIKTEYQGYSLDNNHGTFDTDAAVHAQEYFYDTHTDVAVIGLHYNYHNSPASQKKSTLMPMDRSLKTDFGHQGVIDYESMQNTDSDKVKKFYVRFSSTNLLTATPILEQDGTFSHSKLYKNVVKDENWEPTMKKNHTSEEYINMRGQVILKRTYTNDEPHDTYYVYDEHQNLTFVIPPKASQKTSLYSYDINQLCYQYRYDQKGRLMEKKIPGKEWEYIVYNRLDQPVLTQDALLRVEGKWLFTRYDRFGRIAYTGQLSNTATRTTLQNQADAYTGALWVERGAEITVGGASIFYSNQGWLTLDAAEILTVQYYDDYKLPSLMQALQLTENTTIYGIPLYSNVKGLPTLSMTKVLDTDQWIISGIAYDDRGRQIGHYVNNKYLQYTDATEMKLDYVGKVIESTTIHNKTNNPQIKTIDSFTYDHMGRLVSHHQQIGDDPSNKEMIAYNTYNALGQLEQKKVGNTQASPLQEIDYRYNEQGWLSGINNHTVREEDNLRDIHTLTLGEGDLWGMQINYSHPTPDATPLYNGNISQVNWRSASQDNTQKTYNYTYDALNRIIHAQYGTTNKYNLDRVTYDRNGNILYISRQGAINDDATSFGEMDRLFYEYEGNQLQYINDEANTPDFGFKDRNSSEDDYSYDQNGNMTVDKNKGITEITYNYFNLPKTISISNEQGSGNINYIYDATGVKQKKIVTEQQTSITTETTYAGNYIYKNGTLEFFNHSEGYIEPRSDGTYDYVYQYKDHLGNVRLSYGDYNTDGNITPDEIIEEKNYYPFGLNHQNHNSILNGREHNYGYNGKEENKEIGLDWLDYGARNYDATVGRWMSIDPLASGYTPISTYAYTANNPIRFIDPDGKKIGEGYDYFTTFENAVNAKISSTKSAIENRTARIQKRISKALAQGNKDKATSLQASLDSKNARDRGTISELNNIKTELNALESSEQVYNIITAQTPDGAGGATTFDTKTGAVNVNIGSKYSSAVAAHELKHAYQFEVGQLSFDSSGKRGGALYDLVDEFDGYKRSSLFGYSVKMRNLSDVAKKYKKIRNRTTQLTLYNSISPLPDGVSRKTQLRYRTENLGANGSAPYQYYRNWRTDYIKGSFNGFLKKL